VRNRASVNNFIAPAGALVPPPTIHAQRGLQINNPEVRYNLEIKQGDFSGLQLLSIIHVGIKLLDPRAETGTGLDREYEFSSGLRT
jgi:hypothetical protein